MKPCSRCKQPHSRPRSRYCRGCQAAYMREWRKSNPPSDEQRRKGSCRAHTKVLVQRGQLERKPCWCGARAEAHHPDYSRPRLVIWLCFRHHRELHEWIDKQRFVDVSCGTLAGSQGGT